MTTRACARDETLLRVTMPTTWRHDPHAGWIKRQSTQSCDLMVLVPIADAGRPILQRLHSTGSHSDPMF
jgi:hypothetical protein